MTDDAPRLIVDHVVLDDAASTRAAFVRLNRSEKLNAIDWEMVRELDGVLDAVVADPSVRCVLVTGVGRAFSAGGDLEGYLTLQRDPVAFPQFVEDLHTTFGRLRRIPVPAIALVAASSSCSTATSRSRRARPASATAT